MTAMDVQGGDDSTRGALAYKIPDGSLDLSLMKESICKGYVQMVASAAGLTLQRWDDDFGAVDLTLKSFVDYGVTGGFQPAFDMQLKSTSQDLGTGGSFPWNIDRRTHEKLTNPNRSNLASLAILSLPRDPVLWLEHDTVGLLAKSHLYWAPARDIPPLPSGQASISVAISKSSRFGPAEALEYMKEAAEKWI